MNRRRGAGKGNMRVDPNNLMRQMQKVQQQMETVQAETEKKTVTVSSGGGMVELVISGGLDVKSIKIKPEVVDPEDVEMLEDLVLTALNEGIQKAQALMSDSMASLTGGLGIPGL